MFDQISPGRQVERNYSFREVCGRCEGYATFNTTLDVRFVQPDAHKRPIESNFLILPGEAPPEDEDEDDTVPTRYLDDFSIFDPKDQNKMLSLSLLDTAGVKAKNFEGEGCATVFVERDEDEGQDDDDIDDWPTRIRLTAILRYYVDYSDADS